MSEDPSPYEGTARPVNFSTSPAVMGERAREIRIEALRAAAQVVSGLNEPFEFGPDKDHLEIVPAGETVIRLAKRLAEWLETGE